MGRCQPPSHCSPSGLPGGGQQVIENDPLDIEAETVDGEERTTSIGCTDRGRFLVVVTTLREKRSRCDGVPSSQGPDRSVLCPERGMKPWRTTSNYPNLPARPKRRNGGTTTAKKSPKLSRMLRPAANCSPARPPSSPASPELAEPRPRQFSSTPRTSPGRVCSPPSVWSASRPTSSCCPRGSCSRRVKSRQLTPVIDEPRDHAPSAFFAA